MEHIMIRFGIELEGQYVKPPKLCGRGKLALTAVQMIERLYVMENAQDSKSLCAKGSICNSKIRSADIIGEGAE
jgi:hypothetical protein